MLGAKGSEKAAEGGNAGGEDRDRDMEELKERREMRGVKASERAKETKRKIWVHREETLDRDGREFE